MSKFKILWIDAWCDGQNCPECGSSSISDTTKGTKMKCDSCLNEFDEMVGKSWTWNDWRSTTGVFDEKEHGELNEANALKYFQNEFVTPKYHDKVEIEDDGHNYVLKFKDNGMPKYAIEYGNQD